MKFDSAASPLLPTPEQLTELNDLLVACTELYQVYTVLERHPRVASSPRSAELFASFIEEVSHDMSLLDEQLESLLTLARSEPPAETDDKAASFAYAQSNCEPHFYKVIPDVEPMNIKKSVFETVRKAFHLEDFFRHQLAACALSAQARKHLKLELQLKMIVLSAEQRCSLLEDRYGFARSKSLLFQGLRRQTTRFLSALNGDRRADIDR